MRILNTRRDPKGPTGEGLEALRRLVEEALGDPGGPIVAGGASVGVDADGGIVLGRAGRPDPRSEVPRCH